jgi:hypothetical protein
MPPARQLKVCICLGKPHIRKQKTGRGLGSATFLFLLGNVTQELLSSCRLGKGDDSYDNVTSRTHMSKIIDKIRIESRENATNIWY